MHELAVCQSLMAQVEGVARDHGAAAVNSVTVRIGPLSGVEVELLRQAFPLASADTVAEGATLITELQPIRVHCTTCGAETEAAANRLLCGVCGDWHTRVISGEEMLLASVELQTRQPEEEAH